MRVAGENRLNDDLLGELRANAQANITNLADDVGVLGEKPDFLLLAKAHFTKTMRNFRGGGELFNTDGSSCTNVT